MFYLFDICLGFCALLVCAVYAHIKHAHFGPRLFHKLLVIGRVVVTYIVSILVEAVGNILYLSRTLRRYLCLGVRMCWGTGFCPLLVCAVYAYIKHAHSGPRLFHQLLGIGWVVVTYIVSIWVEAIGNILYLSSTLRCYLCLSVWMFGGTTSLYILMRLLDIGSALPYCFALGVGLCREFTSTYMWIQRMMSPCASVTDLISFLVVVYILLTIGVTFGVNNKRRLNFRKTCSCKWTRRRAYCLMGRTDGTVAKSVL